MSVNDNQNDQFLRLTACDALGRVTRPAGGWRRNRWVGLFYFIWFEGSRREALDTTRLLRTHPDELFDPRDATGIAPPGAMYYFNRPLFGYYASDDPWVIRRHLRLFCMAGIDWLALDLSNDVIYPRTLTRLLDIMLELAEAGWRVPQVVCYTNFNTGHTVRLLYELMYSTDKYRRLWFYGPYDKPLIVAHRDELDPAMREFFTVRPAQWPGYEFPHYPDGVPFCDLHRPQRTHGNLINVSVAQHNGYVFSSGVRRDPGFPITRPNYGRGWTSGEPSNGDAGRIMAGANIREEWAYALREDPEMVFVTGWNEWATNKRLPERDDQTVAWFVDSFNTEFSRDIEMTADPAYITDPETGAWLAEGYGDNYVCQLFDCIRRYKGTPAGQPAPEAARTPDMTRYIAADWAGTFCYTAMCPDAPPRTDPAYPQPAPVNRLRALRVTSDRDNLYFLIETSENAVKTQPDQLNLLVGTGCAVGFGGFSFRIGRTVTAPGRVSVERIVTDGGTYFVPVGTAAFTLDGTHAMTAVSRALLGAGGNEPFSLSVKVTDSVLDAVNLLDCYVSGDTLPYGRFAAVYTGGGSLPQE